MPFLKYDVNNEIQISDKEMTEGFERLKNGKSCGIDGLRDVIIKNPSFRK